MEGQKIDIRHIMLLVDTMTNKGSLMSIDRFGINRGDIGPLARSSFEETEPQFTNGAIFAEIDPCNGVSSNIMLGQLIPGGTGDFEVLFDEDVLMDEPIVKIDEEQEADLEDDEVDEEEIKIDDKKKDETDDICDNLDFNFNFTNENEESIYKMETTTIKVI